MTERKPIDATAAMTMVILCCIWGTQQVAIKLAEPFMAPLFQVGLRSGVAALILLVVIVLRREHADLRRGYWGPGLLAGALFGLEFVLFALGLRFTSASHMAMFLYTAPIFAGLALHVKLPEERLMPLQWLGIAAAFAGIVLTFYGRSSPQAGDQAWIGDLLGLAGGAVWGATTVVVRTSRLPQAPATVTLWFQLMGACVLPAALAVALGETGIIPSSTLFGSLAYQTVVISAASYLAWFSLMRVYLASRLGVLTLVTPVFGIGFGVAIMGDDLTRQFVSGAALILFGILLVSGREILARRTGRAASGRVLNPSKRASA